MVEQGSWFGHRPDMLHIADPRFAQIAAAFLEEQKNYLETAGILQLTLSMRAGIPAT